MPHEFPEGSSHLSTPRAASDTERLTAYAATLVHQDEISELILQLESLPRRDQGVPDDPGLRELVRVTGLELNDPAAVQQAILVLGRRAEVLRQARGRAVPVPELPDVRDRDLAGLAAALLPVLEATRLACPDDTALEPRLHQAVDETLGFYRRNSPPRSEADARWWQETDEAVQQRMVPGFARAAASLSRLENHPFTGLLLRSPLLMAILVALPGLLTFEMPISTPLVVLVLGLVGGFAVHPLWLARITAPLRALEANLAAEGPRIERLAGEDPWPEQAFSLEGVLSDLMPILEGERRAGRIEESTLSQAVSAYFDRIEPRFASSSSRTPRYFKHLRDYCENRVVRRFAAYARARRQLELNFLARIVDLPWLSAVVLAVMSLPVSWGASRISPLPPTIDFPAMILIFFGLGWYLPRLVPGAEPARAALIDELVAHQAELDRLP